MKIFIIAGEVSGDLHGSNLIRELQNQRSDVQIQAWGGDRMEKVGAKIVKHIDELAFMGFVEVIMNIRTIKRNFKHCKRDIKDFNPDALVLIDYPGFNLRIAPFAKNLGIPVIYYISPQIWAWKQNRVYKIKKVVDKMMVILPFEEAFYRKFGLEVEFVGHPLLDAIANTKLESTESEKSNNKESILLLPGSRKQEVSTVLPIFLEVIQDFPAYQFVIGGSPTIDDEFYKAIIGNQNAIISRKGTYSELKKAKAALVTSGTATLETALFKVPEVVCYKGSSLSYFIAKNLVKIKFISLVNIIMDREVVKELIQNNCNRQLISNSLNSIINGEGNEQLKKDYDLLHEKLGGVGASKQAATSLLKTIADYNSNS